MEQISIEIGKLICNFQKSKKMTIKELVDQIHKSKAAVSKYEKGETVIDCNIIQYCKGVKNLCKSVALLRT